MLLDALAIAGDVATVILGTWFLVGFVFGYDVLAWSGRLTDESPAGHGFDVRSPPSAIALLALVLASSGLASLLT